MDKGDIVIYLCRVLKFNRKFHPEGFGTKKDWARYFDPTKYKDNNLLDYVDWLINFDVLKEDGMKNSLFTIYSPDNESKIKAQRLLEETQVFKELDSTHDITRNPKKGSQYL